VDALAVCIGNVHGKYPPSGPNLDLNLLEVFLTAFAFSELFCLDVLLCKILICEHFFFSAVLSSLVNLKLNEMHFRTHEVYVQLCVNAGVTWGSNCA